MSWAERRSWEEKSTCSTSPRPSTTAITVIDTGCHSFLGKESGRPPGSTAIDAEKG